MTRFDSFPEQREAKRLLDAALDEGPAHAYLFHGPHGVGKRELARAFAREVVGTTRTVHPDVYELDALGEMIRIDAIRELRRDLHMRPFESDRRVYLILSADLMNDDAADALLKDLEEPPPYAVIVLVADNLGPIGETIRSRCQLVPFRRLSELAVREAVAARAPDLGDERRTALARVARPAGSTGSSGCSIRRRPSVARRCSRRRARCTARRSSRRMRRPRCLRARVRSVRARRSARR
jgi:replication-associated recombination protein RarA